MSTTKITNEEWVGIPGRAMETYHLRAGNLDALFDGGRLCQICYGGIPVIDEVYYALRDCNWGTIPFEIHGFSIEQSGQEFEVKFKGIHCSKDINYTFLARISGSRESTIEYSFEGTAHSSFLRNRIGFCVLHPASCAGNRCYIEHTDAKVESGVFPIQIAPHQPFCNIKAITHFPTENLMAKTEMTGDIFEMEDQRNWTDASFKTYCTPLKEPFPVMVQQGDKVQQTIRISLKEIDGIASGKKESAKAEIVEEVKCPTFSLGCMIDKPLAEGRLALVNLLHLGHLLFDYHFTREDVREQLKIICCQAKKLNCPLRIRAFFSEAWRDEVEHLNAELRGENIQDISVFFENAAVIKEDTLFNIREALRPLGVPIGSGTNGYFTQVNRQRLPESAIDFISYSNTPQVHAFDNESIMRTVEGSLANIRSCQVIYPRTKIWVAPVSMKIQWNPDATAEEVRIPGKPTSDIDQRQMSLFAASWFIKLFSAFVVSKAAGASCFCLTGCKGIMEEESPQRDFYFPAEPNMLYPLYYAFYGLRDIKQYDIQVCRTDNYTMIKFFQKALRRVVIANCLDRAVDVFVPNLPKKMCNVLVIDEDTIPLMAVCDNADEVRQGFEARDLGGSIHLKRYATIIVEIKEQE